MNGNGNAMEHGCGSWFEDDDDDCDELPRAEGRASAWQHRVRLRTVVIAHCIHYKKWFSAGIHNEQQHRIRKSRQRGEGAEGNGRAGQAVSHSGHYSLCSVLQHNVQISSFRSGTSILEARQQHQRREGLLSEDCGLSPAVPLEIPN